MLIYIFRYVEAFRYQYEPISVPYSATAMSARTLKPPVVSVHTPSEMDVGHPIKRPRLAVEPKAPVHQPLLIDTRNVVIKKVSIFFLCMYLCFFFYHKRLTV